MRRICTGRSARATLVWSCVGMVSSPAGGFETRVRSRDASALLPRGQVHCVIHYAIGLGISPLVSCPAIFYLFLHVTGPTSDGCVRTIVTLYWVSNIIQNSDIRDFLFSVLLVPGVSRQHGSFRSRVQSLRHPLASSSAPASCPFDFTSPNP